MVYEFTMRIGGVWLRKYPVLKIVTIDYTYLIVYFYDKQSRKAGRMIVLKLQYILHIELFVTSISMGYSVPIYMQFKQYIEGSILLKCT